MKHLRVMFSHGIWHVHLEKLIDGPYGTRKEAIRAALKKAQGMIAEGTPAGVLVQCNNNEFMPVRSDALEGSDQARGKPSPG